MTRPSMPMIKRNLQAIVSQRMSDEPVVLIEGPRTVGKSELLKALAKEHGAEIIDLDDLPTREAADKDPTTMLGGTPPVFVDEYQKVPKILDVVKSRLTQNASPGQFILTGSTRHDSLPQAAQSLTGRLDRVRLYPLSQAEIEGTNKNVIADLISGTNSIATPDLSSTTREDYIQRIVMGGLPMAMGRSITSRSRWFDSYVEMTLARDVLDISKVRRPAKLKEVLEKLAGQTAQVLNLNNVSREVGVNAELVSNYTTLLEAVFLILRLPAWGTTLTARSSSNPKIHVMDSGVAARLLRVTPEKLAKRHPTALTELGHLLETFVVGELMRQTSWIDGIAGIGHWRTHDGAEVDFVVESDEGSVIAFEVKTGAQVSNNELEHLRTLRNKIGPSFVAGVALYLGQRSYNAEDRIHVMPVDRLWLP
jgi:predicted AAA+ superfamily ATPase